tara:strand:- start:207 stop:653 length:447 start_codon:yes stop_codon:yes gene_type:complete
MSTLKVNNIQSTTQYPPFILNPSGEEIGKLATAWVVFKSDGSIYNSSNIISITSLGSARYVLSFTPGLRINNPAVAGSSNASTNIVHMNILDSNINNDRSQMHVSSSEVRVTFNTSNASTVTAQSGSTYYTVSVVGDNAYGGFGNLVP